MTLPTPLLRSSRLHFQSRLPAFTSRSRSSIPLPIPIRACFPFAIVARDADLLLPRPQTQPGNSHLIPRVSVGDADRNADDEDLSEGGEVYRKTLRLVECAMLAALSGLAFFLGNTLAIENYFGWFFSLPIVVASLRWGLEAGRRTMVATALLLFTLSGPVKASTYLLMHGFVGLAIGSLWSLEANWSTSIILCTMVRALGAIGYILVTSFLIRENILNLITINVHASFAYISMAIGANTIPSMGAVYAIFGFLLLLNCGFFVFFLHVLYAVFLVKLGMKTSLKLPAWLDRAV